VLAFVFNNIYVPVGINTRNKMNMDELLGIIANPQTDKETLKGTIQKLEAVDEDAKFWVNIANSDQYNQDHRRRAVFALFKRHISPPTTLIELVSILDNPTWLKREDIRVVSELAGQIPVTFNQKDTVFVLSVFPDLPDGRYAFWAIYLRVEGKMTAETFSNILYGHSRDRQLLDRQVLEFALSPDESANVDW
jgi:hypothetical protein